MFRIWEVKHFFNVVFVAKESGVSPVYDKVDDASRNHSTCTLTHRDLISEHVEDVHYVGRLCEQFFFESALNGEGT